VFFTVKGTDDLIRVDNLHSSDFLYIRSSDCSGTSNVNRHIDGLAALGDEEDLLEVQDDIGDVFNDSIDTLELVLHALDIDGGDRGSLNGAEQYPAKGIADGVSITGLKRFGMESGVCIARCVFDFNEAVG
jgi:hypothetical protein